MIETIDQARDSLKHCGETHARFSAGYITCYETDPHVRALVEAAKMALGMARDLNQRPEDFLHVELLEEALRPFEKEEKANG